MNEAKRVGRVVVGIVAVCVALSALAEEPTPAAAAITPAALDPQRLDRDGQPIYGFELMTESEVSGLRSMLFSIKDPKTRDEARAAHRKAMDKRAAERGVTIKE
jgi:hypothetical protein